MGVVRYRASRCQKTAEGEKLGIRTGHIGAVLTGPKAHPSVKISKVVLDRLEETRVLKEACSGHGETRRWRSLTEKISPRVRAWLIEIGAYRLNTLPPLFCNPHQLDLFTSRP